MTDLTDHETADPDRLLAIADHLLTLGSQLPRIDVGAEESIEAFAVRRRTAELYMAQRLQDLPTCRVVMPRGGVEVMFDLAGIQVSSRGRLAGALTAWVATARLHARSSSGAMSA